MNNKYSKYTNKKIIKGGTIPLSGMLFDIVEIGLYSDIEEYYENDYFPTYNREKMGDNKNLKKLFELIDILNRRNELLKENYSQDVDFNTFQEKIMKNNQQENIEENNSKEIMFR